MADNACCKYLMFFFNLLIFLGGAALLGVGIWVAVGSDSFKQVVSGDPAIFNAVYIIIAVGALLFLVGFLGCCGAIKENKFLLGAFFVIVLVIFILEVVGAVLAFVYYPDAEQLLIDSAKQYGSDQTIQAAWDSVFLAFNCCGMNGVADFLPSLGPSGCRNFPIPAGCKSAFQNYFLVLGGIALAVLFVELLAMIFACCIYQNVKKERYA